MSGGRLEDVESSSNGTRDSPNSCLMIKSMSGRGGGSNTIWYDECMHELNSLYGADLRAISSKMCHFSHEGLNGRPIRSIRDAYSIPIEDHRVY